jgi:hypothetical protein
MVHVAVGSAIHHFFPFHLDGTYVPLWLDPFQPGVTFRSKDYIIHQLKPGESYFAVGRGFP